MGALAPWVVLGVMSIGAPWALNCGTRPGYGLPPEEDHQPEEVTYP